MVYDINKEASNKKARFVKVGKLIGINTDSQYCKKFDRENGVYDFVNISMVIGKDELGKDIWLNVRASHIDMSKMLELAKADKLLQKKMRPKVSITYYISEKDAVNEDGNPVIEEVTEMREGREILIQRQKKWKNMRASAQDIIDGFKVLEENMN